jgi:hypothetical protein
VQQKSELVLDPEAVEVFRQPLVSANKALATSA